MDTKEEQLLIRVTANYLFLAQFETFRASILTLFEKNPSVALAILKSVVEKGGRLERVLWSDSVPSPSHLSWLSLAELLALEKRALWDREQSGKKVSTLELLPNPGLVQVLVECLLILETLRREIAELQVAPSNQPETEIISPDNDNRPEAGIQSEPARNGTFHVEAQSGEGLEDSEEAGLPSEEEYSADELTVSGREILDRILSFCLQRLEQVTCSESGVLQTDANKEEEDGFKDSQVQERHALESVSALKTLDSSTNFERDDSLRPDDLPSTSMEDDEMANERFSDKERIWLRKAVLSQPQLFDALCMNIARQADLLVQRVSADSSSISDYKVPSIEAEPAGSRMDLDIGPDSGALVEFSPTLQGERSESSEVHKYLSAGTSFVEENAFVLGSLLQKEVQRVHLSTMRENIVEGRVNKAFDHIGYLHEGLGFSMNEYSDVINLGIEKLKGSEGGNIGLATSQETIESSMLSIYEKVIASGSPRLLSMVEAALDAIVRQKAECFQASTEQLLPPPLQRLHERLERLREGVPLAMGSSYVSEVLSFMGDMFHYARVNGAHVLEIVINAALSAVKNHQIQVAADVLVPFPRLQSLVAVMGWDVLTGKTAVRRKVMEILWASKSKSTRLEGLFVHWKQAEETSCVEHLCDQLCYYLELAYFAAHSNSGLSWDAKSCRLFPPLRGVRKNAIQTDEEPADGFVANLVLERLSMHSPIRVLFDVVPNIKLKDSLELVKMQPAPSPLALLQRQHDIELLHMHYGIQAAINALAAVGARVTEDRHAHVNKVASASFLKDLQEHLSAVTTPVRRIWMMSVIVSLLHMDESLLFLETNMPSGFNGKGNNSDSVTQDAEEGTVFFEEGKHPAIAFVGCILGMLRKLIPPPGFDLELKGLRGTSIKGLKLGSPGRLGREAWERKVTSLRQFIDDWEWRLAVLQRLSPSYKLQWQWKEALAVLRAAPSTLLNMCVQRAQYDLGEEAVSRFALPPEDAASLQLAEWVDGAVARASVEDAVTRVAQGAFSSDEALKLSASRAPLAPLARVLLCIDVAAASARSLEMSKQLLDQARGVLLNLSHGVGQRQVASQMEQVQEACVILVARRVLQRLQELLEQDQPRPLQVILSGADVLSSSWDHTRQGARHRALGMLQQIIEDAHNGIRQFLSGKLHNLVKALADEDLDESFAKLTSSQSDKKVIGLDSGLGPALGLRISTKNNITVSSGATGDLGGEILSHPARVAGNKRLFGLLNNKPTAYLSAFILYIATIGDIVDGVDTTHDFNFFSLVYERPNDLLTRLVFERGSADAAGKVAEIMGADLVHQVISACVPPVFPPIEAKGLASIPRLPSRSNELVEVNRDSSLPSSGDEDVPLYPIQLDVIKHLAISSPVRAILACVFGSCTYTMLSGGGELKLDSLSVQQLDADRSFYEFAVEQSERYPTLNRWIQLQANLRRFSEHPISSRRINDLDTQQQTDRRSAVKRFRELESDTDSEDDDDKSPFLGHKPSASGWKEVYEKQSRETSTNFTSSRNPQSQNSCLLLLDWENERPYEEAVQRLMEEGKLIDALALADRWLPDGAPDLLLQLLMEQGEDGASQSELSQGYGPAQSLWNNSWQYCIRLRDKSLAASLSLKFLHRWELGAAIDVLTMCSCHLHSDNPLYAEVMQKKQALQQYNVILRADGRFTSWQQVEAFCKTDPEGLAMRLAAKGAVTAALEVAESFGLSEDLRRELQGRQLVKLLTADPLSGGGPAEGLRFFGSLRHPEDALPVAMAAMEQLPNLQSKQLLIHFFLKRRVGTLSEDEHARLDRLALGLRMLGALPLPWQQRCSALHGHPQLILETLLMWKQLQAASQLLQAFPSLRDDNLIIVYAAKAISAANISSSERRVGVRSANGRPLTQTGASIKSSPGVNNSVRETGARRAFSWTSRDTASKVPPKEFSRKRKISGLPPSQKATWEAMAGIQEEHPVGFTQEGYDRLAPVTMADEWVLTGDPLKDDAVRSSHRYESAPSFVLFQAILSLYSEQSLAAKASVELCVAQIKSVLSTHQLPLNASSEIIERAFHATETFVQVLLHSRTELRKLVGSLETSTTPMLSPAQEKTADESSNGEINLKESSGDGQNFQILTKLLLEAEVWLNRVELLQSLLGSGVIASVEDVGDEGSAFLLRDRLITEERYSMAVYTCTKCKIDVFPVWEAWGHALLRIEHYAQARLKFKQALKIFKGDPAPVVRQIVLTMEAGPPVDVSAVRSLYEHMAKSVSTSSDDSLSADSYLNVLYIPSYTKSERLRKTSEDSADHSATLSSQTYTDDTVRSNLDNERYEECLYYLQEYVRQDLLQFMFRHGHYSEACLLFFPPSTVPSTALGSKLQAQAPSSTPQKPDPLATDFGSIDDLCEQCVAHGAIPVLERILSARVVSSNNQDTLFSQHTSAALSRICNYCETHRHFNHLYRFQVLKKDYIAAGLCCIQLFLNSSTQEQALRHLERAKVHFDEGLSARQQGSEGVKSKVSRGKSPSEKLTEEELIKFSARVALQMEVVRFSNDSDGQPWKHSLFGNPNDGDTFKRRCEVAEALVERNFDLAFQIIYDFNLPAVHIYAGVAASLAERRRFHQLTELLKNIKGTIEDDDWDQVIGAAINVYANKHRERPDRLIDMLKNNHRHILMKVLACVICGRLKSAFQIASRSGNIVDVQWVAHQARLTGALPVEDMCKQWLAQTL
ncbi:hypothetical protein O6H91_12G054900 [Diphasiastrum complanatum]|uniref:Uncharacterized protein n=1 Tax=Diphasiastrum complanatum TaxID=34168 RepID=A0ACC2C275_DIPCM|nr:hypothetical protein O6H91_12G054900 [Diphasiastrum complanatum]